MIDDPPDNSPATLARRWAPLAALPVLLFFGIWMGLQVHFLRSDTTALRDEVAALHTQVVELKRSQHLGGLRSEPSRPSGRALPEAPKAQKAKAKGAKAKGAKAKAPIDADGDGQPDAAKAKGKAKAKAGAAAEGEVRDAKAQPRKAKGKKKRKKRKPAAR